ncbi:hypothetical protein GCM10010156_18080 [Planobispora rosea]|uniref:CsbD family protein n=2 Tax=Planobispora rosea TaxID=35762 RepID=A0A8J3WCQ9_PLARO|nr:hypothetical protein [Planobispora rosea]GGS59904.1 hypothetical protein GCM10010156_18080 [Planobispora rosea]GIH84092.1 hypothetical protein Pro02_25000 [Planobispora rosea]
MSLMEKFNLRELKARAKRQMGHRIGDRRLAAEGRTEEAEAKLLKTQDEILEAVAEMRREYGLRRRLR